MTLKPRSLRLSIFFPLAMLLLVGSSAMFWISKTAKDSHAQAEAHQQQATKALEVVVSTEAALLAFDEYLRDVTSFNQIISQDEISATFVSLRDDVAGNIKELSAQVEMGVGGELTPQLEADVNEWFAAAEIILGLQRSRHIPTIDTLDQRRNQIQSKMTLIYELARQYEERSVIENRVQFQEQMAATQFSLIVLLIIGGLFAFYRANHLATAMRRLSSGMDRIRKSEFDFEISDAKRQDEIGDMARNLVSFSDDLQELIATKEHVEYLALHDALTGLRNRRCMDRRLESMSSWTNSESDLAAYHLDLDRFKLANDTYGHHAGDAILKHIASVLIKCVSATDLIFRVGGDEFLILSHENATMDKAKILAKSIIERVSVPIAYGDANLQVSASVGIAFLSQSENDPDVLLSNADLALYDAKGAGRARYEFSSKARRIQRERRNAMLEELKHAIAHDELTVFFQPQVDVASNEIVGLESLLRWHHPERGVLSPALFLDVAMENGLSEKITAICIDQSILALKTWRGLGLKVPGVSVNLAAVQLGKPGLVDWLHERVLSSGLQPNDIVIEIVESVLFGEHEDLAVSHVKKLRDRGYRIELDDFGTGHASISNLTRFKVDKIKIDRTFVSGMDTNKEKRSIVSALVDLSRNLGIECLAEGVESDPELEVLLSLNCSQVQGYAISRPLSLKSTSEWLLSHANAASVAAHTGS